MVRPALAAAATALHTSLFYSGVCAFSLQHPSHSTPTRACFHQARLSNDDDESAKPSLLEESISDRRTFFLSATAAAGAALAASSVLVEEVEAADVQEATPQWPLSSNSVTTASATASATAASAPVTSGKVDFGAIFQQSSKRALGGGKAGASAAVVQVLSLMWLRTAMNYQYRYGGDLTSSLKTLYSDGGIGRLYQGLPFALVQGPLTRFGDTAANVGVLALLDSIPETQALSLPVRTAVGSITAGLWRIVLMPVDTSKTAMQVEGKSGLENLFERVGSEGPGPLYQGSVAAAAATAAGHFPWYLTYNSLNEYLPMASKEEVLLSLLRSAFLGLSASCVSDCVSNSLRVIKTTKQTAGLGKANSSTGGDDCAGVDGGDGQADGKEISYQEALQLVLETDGIQGLFFRGLQTRLLTNAIQGAMFSVLWKYFQTVQA
eukprot:CAMPEP_0185801822 /NCGR_PEP_ID=MMETSP1322-20130828/1656_1 /TAXON_ID=265543 /ORGANISM="Minutocellus polymorphus, Strain RCC2270" /LENGTH=435 /DNA_ID=CAMNT_0028497543 /DNA_START=19 /DNA_END=1326 /DNA_ORIENTATION=+